MDDGSSPAKRVGVTASRSGGWLRLGVIGSHTVAQLATGAEDGPAVDHMAVSKHGFTQRALVEAPLHGARPCPVGVDEQRLCTDHSIEVPA